MIVFDEERGVGAGEYTFEGRNRYHGVTVVGVRGDKVARWREYQYASELEWDAFAGDSRL